MLKIYTVEWSNSLPDTIEGKRKARIVEGVHIQ